MAVLHSGSAHACGFVPPYLLARLADDGDAAPPARATLDLDAQLRTRREAQATVPDASEPPRGSPPRPGAVADLRWTIHDAGGRPDLPGKAVRGNGQPATGDVRADQA